MKLIVHIGLPKTATTYLQAIAHSETIDLEKSGICYPEDPSCAGLINHLTFSRLVEESNYNGLRNLLSGHAKEARKRKCHTILLSHEDLVTLTDPQKSTECIQSVCQLLELSIIPIVTTRPWRELFISLIKQEIATLGSANFSDRIGKNGVPTIGELFIQNALAWEQACGEMKYLHYNSESTTSIEQLFFKAINCEVPIAHPIAPQNSRRNKLYAIQAVSGLLRNARLALCGSQDYDMKAELLADELYSAIDAEINSNTGALPAIFKFEQDFAAILEDLSDLAKAETISRLGREKFEAIFPNMVSR